MPNANGSLVWAPTADAKLVGVSVAFAPENSCQLAESVSNFGA